MRVPMQFPSSRAVISFLITQMKRDLCEIGSLGICPSAFFLLFIAHLLSFVPPMLPIVPSSICFELLCALRLESE